MLKVLGIVLLVFICLFLLTLVIYFFNLDMKFAALLIRPLSAYYDWSKKKRDAKKEQDNKNKKDKQQK